MHYTVFEELPWRARAWMSNGFRTMVTKAEETSDGFAQHEASPQTSHNLTAALINLADIL